MSDRSGDDGKSDDGDPTAERVARNDATFRAANEQIGDAASAYEMRHDVPFLCECADPTCREIVTVSLAEYERVRGNSRHFLNVPGHQRSAGPHARVVARRDGFVVVEKLGRAGEIVEELDPRSTRVAGAREGTR